MRGLKKRGEDFAARGRFPCAFLVGLCLCALFSRSLSAMPSAETAAAPETAAVLPVETILPPHVKVPESVVQGDVLSVLVNGKGIDKLIAKLADKEGKEVLSCRGFLFSRGELINGEEPPPADSAEAAGSWALVAGISSVQAPGDYKLLVHAVYDSGREFAHEESVKILGRNFVREDIPLNEAMSSLRADSDPRKAAESRELWALLSSVNPASVYHAGKLVLPIAEGFRETSFFGDRRTFLYTDGGKGHSVHYGIDYATPRGTPVHAAGAGKVVMAKQRVLTGFSVVIEHLPGVYSLYYHMDKLDVKEGQMVHTGDKIGDSGFTGLATGPHLHWEVRAAGNAVEPKTLMGSPFIP